MLIDKFGDRAEYAAVALYLTSFAVSTFSLITGLLMESPVLTRCMFSASDVPALNGSPTPGGMSMPTIIPDFDVAKIHAPLPNAHDCSEPSMPPLPWNTMKWWLAPFVIQARKPPTSIAPPGTSL